MRFGSRGPSESLLLRISEETEICIGRENARRLKSICGERGSFFFSSDFSVSIGGMVELRRNELRNSIPAEDLSLPRPE